MQQSPFEKKDLMTVAEASSWASEHLEREVSGSNISYLVQYGKVKKYGENGNVLISKNELAEYYRLYRAQREITWQKKLGEDCNWELSFDRLREKDTTKHVHRLHPYKGKFIPQLVEYFIDGHTDDYKKETFFSPGDSILDPFCGSGTTLVQANETGMHAIGIDVSTFNSVISNAKISKVNVFDLASATKEIADVLSEFDSTSKISIFDKNLREEIYKFNSIHFPSPDFRYKVTRGMIDEEKYASEKEKEFLPVYEEYLKKYDIKVKQKKQVTFLDKWFIQSVREEIDIVTNSINGIQDETIRNILTILLSRTVRSCRATTHSDLATLKEPRFTTYYCVKHKKICKPIFSIKNKWSLYSKDTLKRFETFKKFRTDTKQYCLTGDSRNIDIITALKKESPGLANLIEKQKIAGIFSSPPYVGLIDYHEQHRYSYDLFGFERNDELEIGPLSKGGSKKAREEYVDGISDVLKNCIRFLKDDFNIFLVANDKFNLYPVIAENAGCAIVNKYKRPVLNRTERDTGAYSEIIFHLKSKDR
jgi:hypothetical protein